MNLCKFAHSHKTNAHMLKNIIAAILLFTLFSCNDAEKIPDVSNIKINLTTQRFEHDFFNTDATTLMNYVQQIRSNNPSFTKNYLLQILGVDPRLPLDSSAKEVNAFIKAYRNVYDTSQKLFSNFTPYENEIRKGFQFIKYYYPAYKLPEKIITYIGPADGYGDALSNDGILVGLHHHLGKNFALYKTEMVSTYYPEYISRCFEPDYISINCMKNILDDMYPEKEDDKPLIILMIEKGKRLYLLNKFLPTTEKYKLIGYSKSQYDDCIKNEAVVWNLFVKNAILQSIDKNLVKNYISEGPKTQELGNDSPGNIGSFAGWQIVRKYMQKNPTITLQQLMDKDDETIFQEAKYKP